MERQRVEHDIYRPVSKGSLTEEVVSQIQDSILANELRPGDQLPSQRELAAYLGVSATVVREALKTLVERGLLETRAGIGTFVSSLTPQIIAHSLSLHFQLGKVSFDHLYEVRKTLDVEIAGLAAVRAKAAEIAKMKEALQRMDNNLDNPEKYINADFDFHLVLAHSTQNPIFPVLTLALLDLLQENRAYVFRHAPEDYRKIGQAAHYAILGCVERGDSDGARNAMREHLRQSESYSHLHDVVSGISAQDDGFHP